MHTKFISGEEAMLVSWLVGWCVRDISDNEPTLRYLTTQLVSATSSLHNTTLAPDMITRYVDIAVRAAGVIRKYCSLISHLPFSPFFRSLVSTRGISTKLLTAPSSKTSFSFHFGGAQYDGKELQITLVFFLETNLCVV